ncbi:hypothetical protein QFC21_003958 [Naganishia friedmannii]|uniref:Uncharacterized protein n=1 Tax=Naganishia friedmannii TaxID=89922 RepID=A0ACC2VLI8_9TREE|nr:hypothetical protein QFC21_003958 [Naganishia friedmannii]
MQSNTATIEGDAYVRKLLKYLSTHKARLAVPPHFVQVKQSSRTEPSGAAGGIPVGNIWQQSYTIATLGLDPTSSPLNSTLATVFSLGLASGASGVPATALAPTASASAGVKPLTLRLPPDRILYLLLLFQASPSSGLASSPLIRPTDTPLPSGVSIHPTDLHAVGKSEEGREGDVQSVRSWVGSLRSVGGVFSGGSKGKAGEDGKWTSWFAGGSRKKETMDDDTRLRLIYTSFTLLPSLCLHAPSAKDPLIADLVRQGVYTRAGGIDVRIPLGVFRSLWNLELEAVDPRSVIVPVLPGLKALTIKDVPDGEDWLEGFLWTLEDEADEQQDASTIQLRFPSLQYLSLPNTALFSFPLPVKNQLSSLTHLDLSSNLLNALPSTLAHLPNLTSLNMRNNMLSSVRGAAQQAANVRAINLRENRIDCLSGLDGLIHLERLDIRGNAIHDSSELSRLAVVRSLREIWVSGNPFTETESEGRWRVGVFIAFVQEQGDGVLDRLSVDGYVATWTERRSVLSEIHKRGRERHVKMAPDVPVVRQQETTHLADNSNNSTTAQTRDNSQDTGKTYRSAQLRNSSPAAHSADPISSKRRKQRIVQLNSAQPLDTPLVDQTPSHQTEKAGPSRVALGGEAVKDALVDALESPILASTRRDNAADKSGRARAPSLRTKTSLPRALQTDGTQSDDSTLETSNPSKASSRPGSTDVTSRTSDTANPEALRQRMEALKREVGDSWLSVLAEQARVGSSSPGPGLGRRASEQEETAREPQGVEVVHVKRKQGSKAKAKAKARAKASIPE